MGLFEKHAYLIILISFSLLVSGCGKNSDLEVDLEVLEVDLEVVEGPPQVKITLHSELELDFSLDPEPQLQVSQAEADEFEGVDNKFIAGVYAKLKRSAFLRAQSGKKPEYETDTEYQAIQRYENAGGRYTITMKKSPQKPQVRETVKVEDKPLVFAGRGYNISAFEKESKPAIDVDYATHLLAAYPEPPASEIREQLDLKTEYSKDTKYLVYGSTRSAFGKLPPPLVESKPELAKIEEPAIPPERNPDSVLLFPKGEKSLLVLRKAEKQFDLLAGNESLNKKQFKAPTVPETSKKISSTLQ